jgi:hypothetical protein
MTYKKFIKTLPNEILYRDYFTAKIGNWVIGTDLIEKELIKRIKK